MKYSVLIWGVCRMDGTFDCGSNSTNHPNALRGSFAYIDGNSSGDVEVMMMFAMVGKLK